MDNNTMAKIHNEARKMNQERSKLYSQNRLSRMVSKKMQTAMIGNIAACEEIFGFLWGQDKLPEDRNDAEKEMYNLWSELRTAILDKSNIQARSAVEELANYTISFNKYKTDFIIRR